ncbi:MAG: DUF1295 domain-containing protein [Crocinitomicaceae bacterium]|nr:DUF1295 domain-containing protein [Crocinitomicaceae bacterium]
MADFYTLVWVWAGIGILVFFILVFLKIKAPYGRHSSDQWGPVIDNKWGWFWMELPAFIVMPLLALTGPEAKTEVSYLLVFLWSYHYFFRTFVFPFRLKTKNKKMPLVIVCSALFFNGVNGLVNGYFLGFVSQSSQEVLSINVIVGLIVFCLGMIINRHADKKLIALRKKDQGYFIPKGGLFNYLSCPNHFGEIVEWAGFAIIAWSVPALSFFIWTFCNLVPRALNHHQWYQSYFKDYPNNRKAVIPFIW